jgi:DNA-binding XRE family transcriptional regulator
MTRNVKELRAKISPERRARIAHKTRTLRNEMALNEMREAVSLTQESLVDTLGVKHSSIPKMERRSDMYLTTLRKIIRAMAGELDIIAIMPDGPVRITQFNQPRADKKSAVG